MERTLANAFLPGSRAYGFYGLGEAGGLSMGHSDALRTIPGVADVRQYTHAVTDAIDKVRVGENPQFAPGDMHTRECFVVLEEGADQDAVAEAIRTMPGYFAPYKTTVHFVTREFLKEKCSGFPHDGLVVAAGTTGDGNPATVEYRCKWGSNPEATANVLVAHARAAVRLADEKKSRAFTILDIPPAYFSIHSKEELLKKFM
jgi:diaminopimelate dehydrogenase